MRRLGLTLLAALIVWVASASATTESQWSPWFRRTEVVSSGHRVSTVVVPVEIQGEVYVCIISEDSAVGAAADPHLALAQSCDFGVPR